MSESVPIPMVDVAKDIAQLRGPIEEAIATVLDSGRCIMGPEVEALENEVAEVFGTKHAIGVSSGTDALLCSLMALGVSAGDEIITTAFTFFATAGVIARLGAKPVFVDIEPESFCLDSKLAEAAITGKTKAIIPVNLFGRVADIPVGDVPIIEDAAQSIGTAPLRGLAAAVSFFPTKNVGALGDAGAIVTGDDAFAERARLLRNHGAKPKYHHALIGGNFRIDAIHAAILRKKLPHLGEWNRLRREGAKQYREGLSALAEVPGFQLPQDSSEHTYHQFTLRVPRRRELQEFLKAHRVGSEVYYPKPLHLQECFDCLGYKEGDLPHTESAAASVLSLPIHPTIDSEQRARVIQLILEFFESPAAPATTT